MKASAVWKVIHGLKMVVNRARKNYKALTEKIGVENRYYVELLNTGKIEALLLRREISRILFQRKAWTKCRKVWKN